MMTSFNWLSVIDFTVRYVHNILFQGKALLKFIEAISEKTLRSTVVMTAARGRGKSAALGLAMSSAVAFGYSNIFVTAPSPENLKTMFEFIFKGFDALDYQVILNQIYKSRNLYCVWIPISYLKFSVVTSTTFHY